MKRKHFLGALGASALAFVAGGKAAPKEGSDRRRVAAADGLPRPQVDPRSVARTDKV